MNWNTGALREWLDEVIWSNPGETASRAQTWAIQFIRVGIVLMRDLSRGQLTLRAMGLVYTTLLSIVPLLAISFSVLKAFGAYNQIRPMLLGFLEPLGEKGIEITARIMEFIENINVGVLGFVGLALLLYTAVSLVQKVEEAFNFIWHVNRARSIGERFSRYVSALLVGPLLVFSAIGVTAAVASLGVVRDVMQVEAIGWLALQAGRLVPYALVIAAFSFFYTFMPNTKVRMGPALAGGLVGGFAWQSAGWGFAQFAASSTNYAAIYSSFAILILFMLWLYLSWLILLFGSSVAFYVQHPEHVVKLAGKPELSSRMRERLALVIMSQIGRRLIDGQTPWSSDALTHELRMPKRTIDDVLMALQAQGILTVTADAPPGWLPLRDIEKISAQEILDTIRAAGEDRFVGPDALPATEAIDQLLRRCNEASALVLRDVSVKTLASALPQ